MINHRFYFYNFLVIIILFSSTVVFSQSLESLQMVYINQYRSLVDQLTLTSKPKPVLNEMEKLSMEFYKRFPDDPDGVYFLYHTAKFAEDIDSKMAKLLYQKVIQLDKGNYKEMSSRALESLNLLGKPVKLQFTDINGKPVDLTHYKGKVVLVDFWATWCGPCVYEIPNVVKIYQKYHDRGFEIVGISFDEEKESLLKMTKEKGMTWTQYFDGKGWENDIGKQLNIFSLPTMWLVDQKGNLVSLNARLKLEDKVSKLLEKSKDKETEKSSSIHQY